MVFIVGGSCVLDSFYLSTKYYFGGVSCLVVGINFVVFCCFRLYVLSSYFVTVALLVHQFSPNLINKFVKFAYKKNLSADY